MTDARRRRHAPAVTETAAVHPAELVPPDSGLQTARLAAFGCRACELWANATQTVFGEGSQRAGLALVGEQPGDQEDRQGHPFVGPAGKVLEQALETAGIDPETVFVTNVVKHFRWKPNGKRRLHERPNASHVRACRPWLELELEIVRPKVIVALGATAAQALIAPDSRSPRAGAASSSRRHRAARGGSRRSTHRRCSGCARRRSARQHGVSWPAICPSPHARRRRRPR